MQTLDVKYTDRILSCNVCGKTWHESLPFLSHPMSRITKSFTKLMIRFRESMSIADVARSLGVDWRCVKDAEKAHLALKYRNNSHKGVSAITIDETCLFPHERPSRKYVTIVRDAATGSPHVRLRRFAGRRRLERTDCTPRLLHDPAGRRLAVLPETPHGDLRSRAIIVAALLAVFTVRRAADCITGRLTRVSDGDTVWVTDAAKLRHKVRLDRIDAPEKDQPWGKESAAALKRWVFARVVRVEYEKHDRYGRLGPRAG